MTTGEVGVEPVHHLLGELGRISTDQYGFAVDLLTVGLIERDHRAPWVHMIHPSADAATFASVTGHFALAPRGLRMGAANNLPSAAGRIAWPPGARDSPPRVQA